MMSLGLRLTLLIGATVPTPAPLSLTEALKRVEITEDATGRSGFQISFEAPRSGPTAVADHANLLLLQPFTRVVLVATVGFLPHVLMDGLITHVELQPGGEGGGTISVTGEDLTVVMDLEEKSAEHPAQPDPVVATKILATYAQYGILPVVVPPTMLDVPLAIDRTPSQQGTDLEHLRLMAERNGHVFYIKPGPAPLTSQAYWGPPERLGAPQPALTVDMGGATNVDSLSFRSDGLRPHVVAGQVQDRTTNTAMPVQTFASLRTPLVPLPAILVQGKVRSKAARYAGLNYPQALGLAQAQTDRSTDDVVTAQGSLQVPTYGSVLRARSLVDVRGAGALHDGFYLVTQVTHVLEPGSYKQDFTLAREGWGPLTPLVVP